MDLAYILKQILLEEKKKADRCKRIADRKYDKPSAYKSGAIVRCRQGNIWKDLKEEYIEKYNLIGNCVTGLDDPYFQRNVCYDATEMAGIVDEDSNEFLTSKEFIEKINWDENILGIAADNMFEFAYNPNKDIYWAYNMEEDVHYFFTKDKLNENYKDYINVKKEEYTQEENLDPSTFKDTGRAGKYGSGYSKYKKLKEIIRKVIQEDESLHKWFKRSGPKGKEGGWVDCNTCKDGSCKACGRKKDEKRSKYPSCRPTVAQCKTKGKGKKWGKTK